MINISPDVNPSHTHADIQIPINGASDPAFGLALAQVMFAENIADWKFLKEQTDFGFLVRTDTRRYLRQTDVEGKGREDQLYQWVPGTGLKLADRGNMHLKGVDIALEGVFDVKLADGSTVQVTPGLRAAEEEAGRASTRRRSSSRSPACTRTRSACSPARSRRSGRTSCLATTPASSTTAT